MVFLADSFNKLYSRLEDNFHRHNHHRCPGDFSVLLGDFESDVSHALMQLLLKSNTKSDFFSVRWIHQLLPVILEINKAFAKLVVDLDHPIGEWNSDFVDEYLNYTLNLLELFNSMSSSLSHLSRERILISYAPIRAQTSPSPPRARLKTIQRKKLPRNLKKNESKETEKHKKKNKPTKDSTIRQALRILCKPVTAIPHIHNLKKNESKETEKHKKKNKPTKDSTIRQAIRILQGVGLWICGIAVTGLHGDETPYLESRKSAMEVKLDTLNRLDSEIYKEGSEKKWVLSEIRDLNEAVGRLIGAIDGGGENGEAEKEVDRKVDEFERQLEVIEKEVNRLFLEVLAGRTQIVRGLAMAEEKEKHW